MKAIVFAIVAVAFLAQGQAQAQVQAQPRALLNAPRALTPDEIDLVLHAAQAAIAGKRLNLSRRTMKSGGIEIVMGEAGRPQRIRVTGTIISGTYPGVARDGTPMPGKPTQRVETRTFEMSGNGGPGISPIFEMLQGSVPLTSSEWERRLIDHHWARALVAPWTPPTARTSSPASQVWTTGDPAPNVPGDPPPPSPAPRAGVQRLWIDASSLLPLRWEATDGRIAPAFDLVYARP